MKFTEKNDFIVKNKKGEYFSKDLDLFKKNCPNSRLHSDLKSLNSFNRSKLHGLILGELLDKVNPDDILKNREEKPVDVMIDNIDQAKEILVKMEIDPGKVSEEFLSKNIGKPEKDFQSIMEVLKPSLEEKAQKLEDKEKELSEKEAELEKTSAKKKEANKKSSRK